MSRTSPPRMQGGRRLLERESQRVVTRESMSPFRIHMELVGYIWVPGHRGTDYLRGVGYLEFCMGLAVQINRRASKYLEYVLY